jgi:AcrR family transcriptional regulator
MTSSTQTARPAQRERALAAMSELVAASSYAQTTVAQIAQRAHLSRTAFYEHFEDKEDCFIAAHTALAQSLIGEVGQAVGEGDPSAAAQEAIGALAGFAEREPGAFYLLTHEAMLAGPRGWQARDELIERLRETIEAAWSQADSERYVPDMPAQTLLGAAIRLIGVHMRRGERRHTQLQDGLLQWLDAYMTPNAARRFPTLQPCAALCASEPQPPAAPQPLPKGRHRQPAQVARRVQRERLLYASAEVVRAQGHVNVSVNEIVRAAGVSRKVFYGHFHDRREALLAAQTLYFEQTIGACASALFNSAVSWPQRIWDGCEAVTRCAAKAPALSYLTFVHSYALGPEGVRRADDSVPAFSIFLQEGRSQQAARKVPQLASEAIFATVLEITVQHLRHGPVEELPGLLPLTTYAIAAPFIGSEAAKELVEENVRAARDA